MFILLVSIIIVNYNGESFLRNCLTSVLKTNYPEIEIIVVDNGSTDYSSKVLNSFALDPRIKIISNKANVGYAEGNNAGINLAKGEYLVFLNNDTVVDPNWVAELVKPLESDFSIGAAQSKLLLLDYPTRIDCAGNFSDFYGGTFARGLGEEDTRSYECEEIFTCKGASMIVRRKVIENVGQFDPDYFAYYEDTDLCWRIRLAGYKIFFVPSSIVYHKGSGSIPLVGSQSFFFQVYLMKRNRITTLLKNYEIQNLLKYLSLSLIYEISQIVIRSFGDILKGEKIHYSEESSKAIFWNLKHFRKTWKKRIYIQNSIRNTKDRELLCMMRAK